MTKLQQHLGETVEQFLKGFRPYCQIYLNEDKNCLILQKFTGRRFIGKGESKLYWRISDFTEEIKQAVGDEKLNRKTVDIWFKKLEEERIHYVNRTEDTNEKVYNELDLRIGIFIKKKRNENWSLNAIFHEIADQLEVRPFPVEHLEPAKSELPAPSIANVLQHLNLNCFKEELIVEIRSAIEEVAAGQLLELKNQVESIAQLISEPDKTEDERERRFQDMIVKRRVEYQLEKEALLLWTAKPVEERFKKVGLLRKEEDITKRDLFVKDFINRHFAERLKKEIIFEDHVGLEEISI